jgi:hypothetical protein
VPVGTGPSCENNGAKPAAVIEPTTRLFRLDYFRAHLCVSPANQFVIEKHILHQTGSSIDQDRSISIKRYD